MSSTSSSHSNSSRTSIENDNDNDNDNDGPGMNQQRKANTGSSSGGSSSRRRRRKQTPGSAMLSMTLRQFFQCGDIKDVSEFVSESTHHTAQRVVEQRRQSRNDGTSSTGTTTASSFFSPTTSFFSNVITRCGGVSDEQTEIIGRTDDDIDNISIFSRDVQSGGVNEMECRRRRRRGCPSSMMSLSPPILRRNASPQPHHVDYHYRVSEEHSLRTIHHDDV